MDAEIDQVNDAKQQSLSRARDEEFPRLSMLSEKQSRSFRGFESKPSVFGAKHDLVSSDFIRVIFNCSG